MTRRIDREQGIPIYRQLKEILRRSIFDEFNPGDKFYSEGQIARKYDVSSMTVNKVICELALEGLLYRVQGKGTFISNREVGQKKNIVVLLPLETPEIFSDDFFSIIWKGMEKEAGILGLNLITVGYSEHKRKMEDYINILDHNGIKGAVLLDIGANELLYLRDAGIPVVLLDYIRSTGDGVVSISTDNVDGAIEIVEYLIGLGHKRIACIGALTESPSFSERIKGYRTALMRRGLEVDEALIRISDRSLLKDRGKTAMFNCGYRAMKELLKSKKHFTAVFAVNDTIALGAVKAIKEEGLSVPQDISIAGFDGAVSAGKSDPPLTTMNIFTEKMGQLAVRILNDITVVDEPREIMISSQLIVRESCRRLEG